MARTFFSNPRSFFSRGLPPPGDATLASGGGGAETADDAVVGAAAADWGVLGMRGPPVLCVSDPDCIALFWLGRPRSQFGCWPLGSRR